MSDDLRNPIGLPMEDGGRSEDEATEEDYEEVEGLNEELSEDLHEEGVVYDPATQAPKEAER